MAAPHLIARPFHLSIMRMALLSLGLLLAASMSSTAFAEKVSPPPVRYERLPARATIAPVMDCGKLVDQDLLEIAGAPARITEAKVEKRDNDIDFCVVKGIIAPQIQFVLNLPMSTYTGRYLQGGCGGACGTIWDSISPSCDTPVAYNGAFAVGFNNSGHVGPTARDTLWAANAPQLQVDFAYRGPHVSAIVAKEILTRFYGSKPDISYFVGCSDGGREAMEEAQRYPSDFDGILAGAPALWITSGVTRILHEARVSQNSDGQQILTQDATRVLHAAVIEACDGLDGLKDGQIDLPRQCHYDPRDLICKPGQNLNCITADQARVAVELYRGSVDDQGRQTFFGGEPFGSELLWEAPGSFLTGGAFLAANQIKYMIYGGKTHQNLDYKTWNPGEAEVLDLLEKGGFYNANNPDLSAFKASGGKLIMWQGWADNAGGAHLLLDYYQHVRDTMGGFAATDPFLRVYMLPAVYHCAGGYIAYQQDLLGHLVNWVERADAPFQIIASAVLDDGTVRERPIYPYPVRAAYKGSGDINAATSFVPDRPDKEPNDTFDWLGAGHIGGKPPVAEWGASTEK